MNSSDKEKTLFRFLLNRSIDGEITVEEIQQMNTLLTTFPDMGEYYLKLMQIQSALHVVQAADEFYLFQNTSIDKQFWSKMAEHEKTAPEIEIPEEQTQPKLVQKVVYPPRINRKVSKFSLIFLALNAAAILFLILLLKFASPKGGVDVATLADSLHAKWVDVDSEMVNGAAIPAGDRSLLLREGYAELLFNNQARVTIEGPAEFQILTEDQIKLVYGRLYARVPREAIGFTVKTPSAQIVDLGTEFGVDTDFHSDTSLHVVKGKTVLIADDKSNKVSLEVREGDAKKVSAGTQTISDISCNKRLFVREINSAANLVWRGETEISLADIVAGGNGFEKISSVTEIDPVTGEYTSTIGGGVRSAEKKYCPVVASKFIDGVFVPDGNEEGTIPVTSLGHTFVCPDTEGTLTFGIIGYEGDIFKQHPNIPPAVFKGQEYVNNPLLMLHSNAGITFDLKAIRESLPGLDLTSFNAPGGLTEAQDNITERPPDVDFWILVDGTIRYEKKAVMLKDGLISFDVKLSPQDRFLTLIVTDGSRTDGPARTYTAHSNDFFYLINPTLQIGPKGGN